MIPKTTSQEQQNIAGTKIFVNPNFNTHPRQRQQVRTNAAHFNPLYLPALIRNNTMPISLSAPIPPPLPSQQQQHAIHMNPIFLQKRLLLQQQQQQAAELQQRMQQQQQAPELQQRVQQNQQLQFYKQQQQSLHSFTTSQREPPLPWRPRIVTLNTDPVVSLEQQQQALQQQQSFMQQVKAKTTTTLAATHAVLNRKLVRNNNTNHTTTKSSSSNNFTATTTATTKAATALHISKHGRYKLDKRPVKLLPTQTTTTTTVRKPSAGFISKYKLRRGTETTKIRNKAISKNRSFNAAASLIKSMHKKLHMININGVAYKSTGRKLQRKDCIKPSETNFKPKAANKIWSNNKKAAGEGRIIFVGGTKYILDNNGLKLTCINTANMKHTPAAVGKQRQRIDIGGLTYVASPNKNVLVRTQNHHTLAHVHSAKHRSLSLLRQRFVKSNMPCPIFQRLGKCLALERGKCNKVHDKLFVSICARFLRGECQDQNCLLSHSVSLSKMPVCKFFLQAACVRDDCPYLHKKLSDDAAVCEDFLRGFCKLANKCNKRHEFICPELQRSGKCSTVNCKYCIKKTEKPNQKKKLPKSHSMVSKPIKQPKVKVMEGPLQEHTNEEKETINSERYFQTTSTDASSSQQSEEQQLCDNAVEVIKMPVVRRSRIGTLPNFISLEGASEENDQ